MTELQPSIWLARHGETEWSRDGRHTGLVDLSLTPEGESDAEWLKGRLQGLSFTLVLTSPLQRARKTAELAGFAARAEPSSDLLEWNYGDYEGRRTANIEKECPHWNLFIDGCPNGESPQDVAERADHVIARLRVSKGDVLIFGHAHFLAVLAIRWVELSAPSARILTLATGSISVLGYKRGGVDPIVRLWNYHRHSWDQPVI